MEENIAETEGIIFHHIQDSNMGDESTVEETDLSEVDSEQYEFNMNNAYIDNNRPTLNTADTIEEGTDEEEDPDLDMLLNPRQKKRSSHGRMKCV